MLTALVAAGFATFFTGGATGSAAAVLVLTVVVAVPLGGLAGVRLRSTWLVWVVGLAGAPLFTVLALYAGQLGDGPALVSRFGAAARDGWALMLTVGLPAQPTAALLVTPVLVVWLAGFAAAVLITRGGSVLGPLAPPVLGYVVALLVVAARGRSLLLLTGLIALAALGLGVVRSASLAVRGQRSAEVVPVDADGSVSAPSDGSGSGASAGGGGGGAGVSGGLWDRAWVRLRPAAGRLAFGLPAMALIALVGTGAAAVGPIATGSDRFDPRDHRHPPVTVSTALNPLVQVKADHNAKPQKLFTVRLPAVDGKVVLDRIRTVTLADFDGASWLEDGAFVRSGGTLPAGHDPVRGFGAQTRMDVTVESAAGPFLPSFGRPTGIADANLDYAVQPDSGVLAAVEPPRAGDHYVLTARVPALGSAQRQRAVRASGPATRPYLALPAGLPPELADIAATTMDGRSSDYEQLTALTDYLRDERTFSVDLNARPGHSIGALKLFLNGSSDHRGYVEQFATAFALLARIKGFPTRVAVGYLLDAKSSPSPGVFTVSSAQAYAWPEVALAGIGWVAFDPTDISRLNTRLPPPSDSSDANGGGQDAAQQAQAQDPIVRPELDDRADLGGAGGAGGDAAGGILLLVGLIALAVAVAVPVGIVGEKARRRARRRRAGPASARIGGAWREVRDRLAERGVGRSRALTADEVVERTRVLRGDAVGERVATLVPVVTTALFAVEEPDEAAVGQAWELALAASRELRRTDGVARRVTAAVDPRPLLPRR